MDTYGSLIDGKLERSKNVISLIFLVTKKDWAKLHLTNESSIERAQLLQKIATLLKSRKDELAEIITLEMGKPIRETRMEVDYTASYFVWFAEEAKRGYGLTLPSQHPNKYLELRYEPIGPCAIISPWNFPLAMADRKVTIAFGARCPVIIKPSSDTPISLLVFGQICLEAGIQVLVGNNAMIGEAPLIVNDGLPSSVELPFGGIKTSDFGPEGGTIGIYEYLREKVISYKQ